MVWLSTQALGEKGGAHLLQGPRGSLAVTVMAPKMPLGSPSTAGMVPAAAATLGVCGWAVRRPSLRPFLPHVILPVTPANCLVSSRMVFAVFEVLLKGKPNTFLNDSVCRKLTMVTVFLVAVNLGSNFFLLSPQVDCGARTDLSEEWGTHSVRLFSPFLCC